MNPFVMLVRVMALALLIALMAALAGCAATPDMPSGRTDAVTGFWSLPDGQGVIEVLRCETRADALCGRLVAHDGPDDARDYSHPDFWAWGERVCGSQVVFDARAQPEAGVWKGRVYVRAEGAVYHAEIAAAGRDRLDVLLYEGASVDEGGSVAIGAAMGNLPDPIDLGYLAVRAAAGRELLAREQVWRRIDAVPGRCDG